MSDFDWMGDGPASDDPMLDVDALNANVKKAAKSGNIPEIRRLLEQADGYTYTLGVQDQIVGALLHRDFDCVLQATVDPATIDHWCTINAHVLVKKCPALFERWARPIPRYVHAVAAAHAPLDADAKTALLMAPTTVQQTFLRQSLQEHPRLWKELALSWVGPKGSDLREAARSLGWSESMLPNMVFSADAADVGSGVLAYPYSVWALAQVLLKKPAKGIMSSGSLITAKEGASARDVALAQMILATTKRNEHAVLAHPSIPAVPADECVKMQEQVNMHVMLGSLEALLDSLVHDVLPGIDAPTPHVLSAQELSQVDFGGMV